KPCRTLNYALTLAGLNGALRDTIIVADGTYAQSMNVVGKRVTVVGNCANSGNVVITGNSKNPAFWAQDLAVLIVECMKIETGNGNAIQTRQYSIADYRNVVFGQNAIDVTANETSRINCLDKNTVVANSAPKYYALALDKSTISLGCSIDIEGNVKTSSF